MRNVQFNPWLRVFTEQFTRMSRVLRLKLYALSVSAEQWLDSGCDVLNASLLKTDALIAIYVRDVQRYDRLIRS